MRHFIAATLLLGCCAAGLRAQGNYEVQVYGSDLVAPNATMVELHSNFTVNGFKTVIDGVLPDNHAEHETVEITHGFNEWFETGFYIFTSIQPDGSWYYVGSHIRPRFAVPEKYHLPVGISISNEIGWQRPNFSADTWTWEIRPIVDKKIGQVLLGVQSEYRQIVSRNFALARLRVFAQCQMELRRHQEGCAWAWSITAPTAR